MLWSWQLPIRMLKRWLTPFARNGFQKFDILAQIHTDGGKEFVNKLSAELFELLDISHTKMSPAHPLCNPQVEVFNKKVKKFLQSFIDDTTLDFNNTPKVGPITHARAKLIKYKDAAQLALLMLSEGETDIDSLFGGACIACDSENDKCNQPQRKLIKKFAECKRFAKLFLKLKECEDQCYQLKRN
jgi:hypothetical protein